MRLTKKALFIIPHNNFRDKELTWVAERLDDHEIPYQIASTHQSEAKGRFGLLVIPDMTLSYVEPDDYDAIILIGEEAATPLAEDRVLRSLLIEANSRHVGIAAIGLAVGILVAANMVNGRRITSKPVLESDIKQAGGYYTGSTTEVDDNLITAMDPYSVREFGEQIIRALTSGHELSGREYLR